MFGCGLPSHFQVLAKLTQGLAIVTVKLVEQRSPGWIGEGLEDFIHALDLRNQVVACQFPSALNIMCAARNR